MLGYCWIGNKKKKSIFKELKNIEQGSRFFFLLFHFLESCAIFGNPVQSTIPALTQSQGGFCLSKSRYNGASVCGGVTCQWFSFIWFVNVGKEWPSQKALTEKPLKRQQGKENAAWQTMKKDLRVTEREGILKEGRFSTSSELQGERGKTEKKCLREPLRRNSLIHLYRAFYHGSLQNTNRLTLEGPVCVQHGVKAAHGAGSGAVFQLLFWTRPDKLKPQLYWTWVQGQSEGHSLGSQYMRQCLILQSSVIQLNKDLIDRKEPAHCISVQ